MSDASPQAAMPADGGHNASPAATAAAARESRRRELRRLPKAKLIRMLQPHVIPAHPLSTWSKDELAASLLSREFPGSSH